MTAKEKAEELVKKHSKYAFKWEVKQAALITVNEIIEEHLSEGTNSYVEKRIDYWANVEYEIKQL
jgi:hypothetical protein